MHFRIGTAALRALAGGAVALGLMAGAASAETTVKPVPTQYIAALGDSSSTSGTDAATWGLWEVDPGPRGVWISDFPALLASDGMAPTGWQFDHDSWWLEEHGLIMETPSFPLPAGRYVVTGGREVTSVLTVEEPDAEGNQAWSLADGATIYDVTHLRCRAAVYTPKAEGEMCTPTATPVAVFPMSPGVEMPNVPGCSRQEYQVLVVIGMVVDS